MEDWLNQFYLAKMPRTVDLRASTSFTKSVLVHRAHQVIVNTMRDWVTIGLVNMIIENLAVAPPPVRPSVAQSGASRSEDDLTIAYKAIIQHNRYIR